MFRVTSQMMQRAALSNIFKITEDLFRAQVEIASGKRIQSPSDDPSDMRDGLVIRTSLAQASQFIRNINNNGLFMESADSALDTIGQGLTRGRELASAALYQGNSESFRIEIDSDTRLTIGLPGSDVLGVDLNPVLTTQTLVDDLNGGQGVAAGSLQITDLSGASANIAIALGMTVDDVIAAINAAGLNVTAGINSLGNALTIDSNDPASVAIVTDVGPGSVAADLGLGGGRNVITTLIQLKLALERNDTPGITASLANLDGALTAVNQSRAIIGANLRLAENTEFNHEQDIVDKSAALADIEDADLIKSASDLARLEQALQATLAATSQALQPSLLDFLL